MEPQALYTIRTLTLPYTTLLFTTEDQLIAAGHDCQPVMFTGSAQAGWKLDHSIDDSASRATIAAAPTARVGGVGRLNNAAFQTFRAADSRGVSGIASSAADSPPGSPTMGGGARVQGGSTERMTVHQNTITSIRPYAGQPGNVSRFSTSGVDGKLVVWKCVSCLTVRPLNADFDLKKCWRCW